MTGVPHAMAATCHRSVGASSRTGPRTSANVTVPARCAAGPDRRRAVASTVAVDPAFSAGRRRSSSCRDGARRATSDERRAGRAIGAPTRCPPTPA